MEDQRRSPRFATRVRVEYESQNAFFSDYTRNLSTGGVFIHAEHPLPIDTEFTFLLKVPDREPAFQLQGQVVWINQPPGDDNAPSGMGVAFRWDDPAEERAFAEEVARLMRDSLGDALSEQLMQKEANGANAMDRNA